MKGLRLDRDAAGQGGAIQGGGGEHAGIDVGRAGDDLLFALFTAVDLADEEMGALDLFAGEHLAHHHMGDGAAQVHQFLHLEAAAEELFLQLRGGNINIHKLFEPAERYFHLRVPP